MIAIRELLSALVERGLHFTVDAESDFETSILACMFNSYAFPIYSHVRKQVGGSLNHVPPSVLVHSFSSVPLKTALASHT